MILVVDMNCRENSLGFYEFVLPIVSIVKELDDCEVKHYLDVGKDDVDNCDGVILSGTPLKDIVTLRQLDKFQWIKTCGKPIIGICAGMQTIGLIYGSRLKTCSEIGMTQTTTIAENPLFSSTFKAYALHNFSVEPSEEFEILAESARCVQAIKHKQEEIYGVLFHPEVRNQEILQRFARTFVEHRRV
jgi:GMP synthase-like glutamine amidotransferase